MGFDQPQTFPSPKRTDEGLDLALISVGLNRRSDAPGAAGCLALYDFPGMAADA